ncbi:unnamed protein product [Victoria cruziana]
MASRVGASELAKTEKLNGTNFHYWKRRILLALTLERIAYVLKDPYPVLPENPSNEQREDHKKLVTSFDDDDLIAKTIMIAYMEDNLAKVFEDHKTAKDVFEAVSSKYDSKTATHVQVLVQQCNSCKMKESDNVVDHMNKMMVMAKDLALVGNAISDPMQISIILNSLPPSWDMAVTALEVNFANLTLDQLPLLL